MEIFGDEYLLLTKLGDGGFAEVYKAKNLKYDYIRAIRRLYAHVDKVDSKLYNAFIRECKVLLRLGNGCHPNIVHIYQPRLVEGRALVEMDYVDGEDLRQLIKRHNGQVPVDETLRMVREMASALSFCHHDIYKYCYDKATDNLDDDPNDGLKALITPEICQRLIEKYRVIHNDIHTGNIMRRTDGSYILLDFGLAVDGNADVVGSSRMQHGAIEFKSPERADGKDPQPQDDIYSFGCVVYAMLTGQPPFPVQYSTNAKQSISDAEYFRVYQAHKMAEPPAIERDDAPQWLIDLTMRCLSKKPTDRFADGLELYREVCRHDGQREAKRMIERLKSENVALRHSLDEERKKVEMLKKELADMGHSPEEGKVFSVDGVDFKMMFVDGGKYTMGCLTANVNSDMMPEHQVTLSDFYIGETVVTQALWRAVMGEESDRGWEEKYGLGADYPAYRVSYDEAKMFASRLSELTGRSFRLPTEAEWEYAARGGKKSHGYKYSGGNEIDAVAWFERNSDGKTHPVKGKQPNELGLYDMSGNVGEWCADWFGRYPAAPQSDPKGPSTGVQRVNRGGSCMRKTNQCRPTNRGYLKPDTRFFNLGFRLVMVI